MAGALPYVNSYGLVEKVLEKIKEAQTPSRFTHDYLGTNLGMSGGSAMALIPLLKKIGFLGSDGVPTDWYKKFRNASHSKAIMAQAIKHGYKDLFSRNEYAYKLPREKFADLIKEVTGAANDSSAIKQTIGTFEALRKYADFEAEAEDPPSPSVPALHVEAQQESIRDRNDVPDLGLNLSYTINLNLPATSDVAVFNAIFKSLKENLLQK